MKSSLISHRKGPNLFEDLEELEVLKIVHKTENLSTEKPYSLKNHMKEILLGCILRNEPMHCSQLLCHVYRFEIKEDDNYIS